MNGPSSTTTTTTTSKTTADRHRSDRAESDSDVEIDLDHEQQQHERKTDSNKNLDLQAGTTEEQEQDDCSDNDLLVKTPAYGGGYRNRIEETTAAAAAAAATANTTEQQSNNRDSFSLRHSSKNKEENFRESTGQRPGALFIEGRGPGSHPSWASSSGQRRISSSSSRLANDNNGITEESGDDALVHASVVDPAELVRDVLQRLNISESLQLRASQIIPVHILENPRKKQIMVLCSILLVLIIGTSLIVGLWLGVWKDRNNDTDDTNITTPTIQPTIQRILERGSLNCGKSSGSFALFHMDMCYAIAAALFGDNSQALVKFIDHNVSSSRALDVLAANTTVDIMARGHTYTMERDIFVKSSGDGFTFSTPYLYDGLKIAGKPSYIDKCIDNLTIHDEHCKSMKICVCRDCTHNIILRQKWFPSDKLALVSTGNDMYKGFVEGKCNLIANERSYTAESVFKKKVPSYKGEYKVGADLFSKEPLALVTRDDDFEWSTFCDWIIQALLAAERYNITQETADTFPIRPTAFDNRFENMFVNAIKAVGNYGEIYDRHLQDLVPREGLDLINTDGETGLMYSFPYGDLTSIGPEPFENGMLNNIIKRGYLVCGIRLEPGFGIYDSSTKEVWHGMDADFCRALSAGIFDGDIHAVEFVEVRDAQDGFLALWNGTLDVLSGASVTFENSFVGVSGVSGEGFLFSRPYFYHNDSPPTALATRPTDRQWSSFVYWVVSCVVYAEEESIRNDTSFYMPEVHLFGSKFALLFQNVVEAVGNYEQMYTRNLEEYNARNGTRNMLNRGNQPQHFTLLKL